MTNEAILRYAPSAAGNVIQDMTVNDNYSIDKGAFLTLIDPRAVSGTLASGAVCAGICARDKIAGDGRTRVAVYVQGDFDVVASGAIALGAPIVLSGDTNFPNTVKAALTSNSGAAVIGYALETASDAEVFQMRLRL